MKRDLIQRINALGPLVEQMIELQVTRLELGQKQYGTWQEDDRRDMVQEALEEALDGQNYAAIALLKIKQWERNNAEG